MNPPTWITGGAVRHVRALAVSAFLLALDTAVAHAVWNSSGVDLGLGGLERFPRVALVRGSQNDWYVVGSDSGSVKVQRLNSAGEALWPDSLTLGTSVESPAACSDGSGGLLVALDDDATTVLRIGSDGTPNVSWPVDGVNTGIGFEPVLSADGSHGGFEAGSGPNATWVAGNGTVTGDWPVSFFSPFPTYFTALIPDGGGGVYLAGGHSDNNLGYTGLQVAHVKPNGDPDPAWPAGGRVLDPVADWVCRPAMLQLTGGDVLVAWRQSTPSFNARTIQHGVTFPAGSVYVQRITPAGVVASGWPAGGVLIDHQTTRGVSTPELVDDGGTGAFVFWVRQNGVLVNPGQLLGRHVLGNGSFATGWPDTGRVMIASPAVLYNQGDTGASVNWIGDYDEFRPRQGFASCSDAAGGGFLAWSDARNGGIVHNSSQLELRVLRFGASGTPASGWAASGALGARAGAGGPPQTIAADGSGGVVVAWDSLQCVSCGGGTPHLRTHARVNRLGPSGVADVPGVAPPLPGTTRPVLSVSPNPARDAISVRFTMRASVPATLELIDVTGRRIRSESLEAGTGGEQILRLGGLDALPAGVYLACLIQGGERAFARVAVVR
jgi:hypothetical protein